MQHVKWLTAYTQYVGSPVNPLAILLVLGGVGLFIWFIISVFAPSPGKKFRHIKAQKISANGDVLAQVQARVHPRILETCKRLSSDPQALESYLQQCVKDYTLSLQYAEILRQAAPILANTKACPQHGKVPEPGLHFCTGDGAETEVQPRETPAAPAVRKSVVKPRVVHTPSPQSNPAAASLVCPDCGTQLPGDSLFCNNCGKRL